MAATHVQIITSKKWPGARFLKKRNTDEFFIKVYPRATTKEADRIATVCAEAIEKLYAEQGDQDAGSTTVRLPSPS